MFALFALLALYFVPAFVGIMRGHRNNPAITILNFFAGWTFVGWVGALVWAMTDNTIKSRSRQRS